MGTGEQRKDHQMLRPMFNESIDPRHKIEVTNLTEFPALLHGEGSLRERIGMLINPTAPEDVRQANADLISDGLQQYSRPWANHRSRLQSSQAITNPQQDLVDAVEEAREIISTEITPPPTARRRIARGRIEGDAICSDRYLRRVAECWDRSERIAKPNRVLRLAVNLATSADRLPKDIVWRGAVAVALTDELQRQGFRVELVAFRCNDIFFEHRSGRTYAGAFIKEASQPVDVAALSTICCCAGFYRLTFVHAVIAQSTRTVSSDWGLPVDCSRNDVNADVIIDQSVSTKADAISQVKRMLAELGGSNQQD